MNGNLGDKTLHSGHYLKYVMNTYMMHTWIIVLTIINTVTPVLSRLSILYELYGECLYMYFYHLLQAVRSKHSVMIICFLRYFVP